jgi:hypothetical protein
MQLAALGGSKVNGLNISKDIFEQLPQEAKLDAIFDCVEHANKKISSIESQLAKKRKTDAAISAFTGVIGGMLAMIGKWTIFK